MADRASAGAEGIEKIELASLLFDFYGGLLPEKQRSVMEFYHEDDLSLSEIAEEMDISRQAIHYTLKQAEKKLKYYEDTLGLVHRFSRNEKERARAAELAQELRSAVAGDQEAQEQLSELEQIITDLGEL